MNSVSREYGRRRVSDNLERHRKARRLKREMARTILLRISEEQSRNPDVREIDAHLRRPLTGLETLILGRYPEEITDRINIGQPVEVHLNDEVEPPLLEIRLGERE
jgi:hypothetical protein